MIGNKVIRAGLILLSSMWLFACGGSSGGGGDDGAVIETSDLDGDWTSGCFVDAPFSVKLDLSFNGDDVTVTETEYSDATCSDVSMVNPGTFSFTLGSVVSLDGSVAGITSATEFDTTNTMVGPDFGEKEYDLIAIKNDTLYFGDISGANDGSTPALRPTQLDADFVLTRI